MIRGFKSHLHRRPNRKDKKAAKKHRHHRKDQNGQGARHWKRDFVTDEPKMANSDSADSVALVVAFCSAS
jgi:hypothetical protein